MLTPRLLGPQQSCVRRISGWNSQIFSPVAACRAMTPLPGVVRYMTFPATTGVVSKDSARPVWYTPAGVRPATFSRVIWASAAFRAGFRIGVGAADARLVAARCQSRGEQ